MPPGRPRGSGVGRGRGRGRGSASTPAARTQEDAPASEPVSTLPSQQTQNEGATSAATSVVIPETSQPATVGVAASGGPPQRLESARSTHTASPAAGSSSKTRKPVAQPRFAGRRSKEERDAREFEAAQREKARRAEAAAQVPPTRASRDRTRGRGRGRGRGGFTSDVIVSGPFSSGTYAADANRGRFLAGRSSGWSAGVKPEKSGSQIKKEPRGRGEHGTDGDVTMGGTSDFIKLEGNDGYVSSDNDDFEGRRKNIEYINLVSDEEDESNTVLDTLAPVRVRRTEHKDRVIGISTDTNASGSRPEAALVAVSEDVHGPSSTSRKGKARAKDVEVIGSERVWQGVYQDEQALSSPVIKPEPIEDVEMELTLENVKDPGQLGASGPSIERPSSPENSKKSQKIRRKPVRHAAPPTFQTEEERKEWERYQDELTDIINELATVNVGSPNQSREEDGVIPGLSTSLRDDKLYLFQFPPRLPDLNPLAVKPEPTTEADAQTMEIPDAHPSNPSAPIKVEDDGEDTERLKDNVGPKLAPGFAGKLRVYASGKATLDWGGTSLELHVGMHPNFLQEAVLCRIDNRGSDRIGGECMPFGQIKGKFVVTPDWEEILGSPIRMA